MKWQDIVFSVGNIVLSIGLLPSVLSASKPAMLTSLITGLVLTAFAISFISLKLKFSFVTCSITALLWYILFFQVIL